MTDQSRFVYLLLIFLIIAVAACGPTTQKRTKDIPSTEPAGTEPSVTEPEEPPPDTPSEPSEPLSLLEILTAEAEKFVNQQNYQDALFVYNQALIQAQENEKSQLMEKVESILSRMPPSEIQPFLDIKNFTIPRSLLLYWYGLNLVLTDADLEAKQAFETFLFEFADHPYAEDVADLLKQLKVSLYKSDTIGCLLPLSGKYEIFGRRALNGIQFAISQLSEKTGRQYKLIVQDTAADPQKAVECVKILHQKKVAAILGPILTVEEAGKQAQALGIPMIALTQKTEFPLMGDYLFSNFITPEMQVETLGAYLFRELGIQKVAILYPDEKYGKRYMQLFWDVVDSYGGQVVGVEAYDGSKTDFSDAIQKLTGEYYPVPDVVEAYLEPIPPLDLDDFYIEPGENGPPIEAPETLDTESKEEKEEKIEIDFEALFIPDSSQKINLILPQLAFNDATGMYLLGTNLWHHQSLLRDSKGYHKKAVITDGFFSGSTRPVTAAFTKAFEALFGEEPKFLEAIAYDNAIILLTLATEEGVDSKIALKEVLSEPRIYEGVTGNTIFDNNGQAGRNLFLITIKNGKFVEISR